MQAITVPATPVFAVGSEAPADDSDSLTVEHNALTLAEFGNLLVMNGRVMVAEDWTGRAVPLIEAAEAAADAARRHNVDVALSAGDAINLTC